MPFPEGVMLTEVVDRYLDAQGSPAKGTVTFIPDLSAVGEGFAVAPVPVRKVLRNGEFSVLIPASVNTGLDPDFTYEVVRAFSGGVYEKAVYQIPVSEDPVVLSELVPIVIPAPTARFIIPARETASAVPQPGEMYYKPSTGQLFVYDDVGDAWYDLTAPATGPAGGSLAGSYPNPTLAANSVGTAQLTDLSVTAAKLSVSYVPTLTYNNDLATISTALGDLEEADTDLSAAIALKADTTALTSGLAGKANTVHTHTIGQVTDLGLQLDSKLNIPVEPYINASDIAHLVSDETLTESLALKANLANPTFTGTVSGVTKSMVGLGNVDNTSDANKPISTATTTALSNKADLVGGVIPTAQIPAIAMVDFLGSVANQAAMLALVGQKGDWTIRTDLGTVWVITGNDPTQLADWTAYSYPTAPVQSVAGKTGVVTLAKADVGLDNVDNTSDADKPVSTATQTALNLKPPLGSANPAPNVTGSGTVGVSTNASHEDHAHPTTGLVRTATVTAKGDLLTATASGAITRRAVGANDTVLMADSAQADGVKWAAPVDTTKVAKAGDTMTGLLDLAAGAANVGGLRIGADANLYRSAADVLRTDDSLWVIRNVAGTYISRVSNVNATGIGQWLEVLGATNIAQMVGLSGEPQQRMLVQGDGKLSWGSGTTAADTNLYRSAADTLRTDDSLVVSGNLTVTGTPTGPTPAVASNTTVLGTTAHTWSVVTTRDNLLTTGEEVLPRDDVAGEVAIVSGVVYWSFFTARKTETITVLRNATGSTAGASLTLARKGIYSTDGTTLTLEASTASDTAMWTATNAVYATPLSASWNKVAGQRYAIAYLATGTTMPNLEGVNVRPNSVALSPRILGELSGQTNLPATQLESGLSTGFRRFQGIVLPS